MSLLFVLFHILTTENNKGLMYKFLQGCRGNLLELDRSTRGDAVPHATLVGTSEIDETGETMVGGSIHLR
jgi:hypothetical protein